MQLSFRQGIVQQQTDLTHNPNFIHLSSNSIDYGIYVSPDPTLVTFAHGTSDYLLEERFSIDSAWKGPFATNTAYWLYWDIDISTGERTFGNTKLPPMVSGVAPQSPVIDQHWFNLNTTTMNVWSGNHWVEKVRVFAGVIQNGILRQNKTGSQVGLNIPVTAGFLIFDDESKPVKRYDRLGRGKFITTETPLASQLSRLSNIKLEATWIEGKAVDDIPAFYAVAYAGQYQINLASYKTPTLPCVGISVTDIYAGETQAFVRSGYVSNYAWNWTVPPGTRLFVGETGEITTTVPQLFSIQQIAEVVSTTTIFVNIQPIIILS